MVMKKPSKSWDIDLMVMGFGVWSLLKHTNLPAKNERNLPYSFGDRPLATAWQPELDWGSGEIDHASYFTRTSWRHAKGPHDVTTSMWRHKRDHWCYPELYDVTKWFTVNDSGCMIQGCHEWCHKAQENLIYQSVWVWVRWGPTRQWPSHIIIELIFVSLFENSSAVSEPILMKSHTGIPGGYESVIGSQIFNILTTVAMAMKKPSKISYIDLMAMNSGGYSLHYHINWPAKNGHNLPSGFRDRPIATA